MIKAGIIGGAGYTAGELIRLLLNHPQVVMQFVNSSSNAGNRLDSVHSGILGDTNLCFTDQLPFESIDVLFFCTAHGSTVKFLSENVMPSHIKIIDLSTDFRHKATSNEFVYGLPELNKERIKKAHKVANPGCFATAIQLALLPLAKAQLLNTEIHVNGVTGSTGLGVKPSESSHFSWREGNVSVYKAFSHQHLTEIKESLTQLQSSFNTAISFIPVRGNFTRGIFVTAYLDYSGTLENAYSLFETYYADQPFVMLTRENLDLKQVVNTNKCLLYLEKHDNKLMIVSCIDNLLKGASGQAVQNMNLVFGLEENEGLKLKATAF